MAVGAVAGAVAARKVQEERVAAAGAVLHNLLVEQGPTRLQRGDVAGLADRMGIDFGMLTLRWTAAHPVPLPTEGIG